MNDSKKVNYEDSQKAKFMDSVLRIIESKVHGVNIFELELLLDIKGLTTEYLKSLLIEMHRYYPDYITLTRGKVFHVQKTPHTTKFLEEGGFEKLHVDNIENSDYEERLGKQLKELQKENLLLNNQFNKQRLKTHWIPIIISAISLLLALWSFFKPSPKNESQTDEIIEIQKIQDERMDYLEGKLQRANDSLKNELFKADMLINAYEN